LTRRRETKELQEQFEAEVSGKEQGKQQEQKVCELSKIQE